MAFSNESLMRMSSELNVARGRVMMQNAIISNTVHKGTFYAAAALNIGNNCFLLLRSVNVNVFLLIVFFHF